MYFVATKEFRTRNWVSILYPESAVENWQEILSSHHVPALVSPLHDQDISHDGNPKKPHYHVVIMFQNLKTEAQAQEIFSSIGAIKCQAVKDLRGTCRYLIHADDLNKHQYNPDDVFSLCGASYDEICALSSDKYHAVREMLSYIESNNLIYYDDLLLYAAENKPMWFRSLCDNSTVVIKEFLKSRLFRMNRESLEAVRDEK